jgi:hypothetical protein
MKVLRLCSLATLLLFTTLVAAEEEDFIEMHYFPGFSTDSTFIKVRVTVFCTDNQRNELVEAFEKLKELESVDGPIEILMPNAPYISIEVSYGGESKMAMNSGEISDRGNEA